jgi:aspartate aminotransferase-like enzyme
MDELLLTPGPTPLPPAVREALGRPIVHHRTPEYRALFRRVVTRLQQVMRTSQPVCVLTASGTGAMEAAVAHALAPGDTAIVALGGKFAERWQELCAAYGARVVPVPAAYGDAVDPARVAETLRGHPEARALFLTLCETSTGVLHDVEAIAALTRQREALLVVDAISALAAERCETEAWGIDILVGASQKGLMTPPGLSFLSLSPRAWAAKGRGGAYYFDLRRYREALEADDAPFTPAIPLVAALDAALGQITAAGLEEVLRRTAALAAAARAGVTALGLDVFARRPANGLTAVSLPPGLDAKRLIGLMRERHGVRVAGGQGPLAGRLLRIAHLGAIGPDEVAKGLEALGESLAALGYHAAPAGAR